ncbi:MAG TPA: family 16 glycoside hydrolase, partial [Bacteroidales bacterium]|nr:family 16 glycoside hydrolase [Bacteroidales bacterium]
MPVNPFSAEAAPVKLKVKARKIDGWGLDVFGVHASEPPVSPVSSLNPVEEVTLIPFGSERIRLTYFPVIGTPAAAPASFSDAFATNGPNQWTNFAGGWQQKDGKYYSESYGIGGVKSVAMTTLFTDVVYDATITIHSDNAQGGVLFRVTEPAIGVDAYKGYYAALNTSGELILGKASNNWSQLSNAKLPVEEGKPHHLRVIAQKDRIRVFVDDMNTARIDVTDSSFASGAIGLRQYGGESVIFEKVSATNKI